MAWTDIFDTEVFSVGVGAQTAATLNTEQSTVEWIDCEFAGVTYDAKQTDTKRSRRSRGAGTMRLTGRVWPRVSIRFPLHGQIGSYAYASNTPAWAGAMKLLDFLGGSSALTYQAAGISGSDGNTVTTATSASKAGCLLAARDTADGVVRGMGFAKSAAIGAVDVFEDMAAQPGAGGGRLPSVTLFPGATQAVPVTVRVTGEAAAQDRRYVGCVLSRATIKPDEDDRLYCVAEFICYGGETRASSGGLQAVTDYLPLEPQLARGGARWVLGSNVFTTLADGTVDPDGTCDIRDVELVIDIPHYISKAPSRGQGVKEVVTRSPVITASFTVPEIPDFQVSGEQFAEKAWRDLTQLSLSCYMGDTPGQVFAWNMPRGLVTVFPENPVVDGILHRRISLEAGNYTGDAASTDAGNKTFRMALA